MVAEGVFRLLCEIDREVKFNELRGCYSLATALGKTMGPCESTTPD